MKKIFGIIGCVVLIFGIGMGIMVISSIKKMDQQLAAFEFQDIDMQKVHDGVFTGEAETTMVKATVEVNVKEHKMTEVKITRHENGKGTPAEGIVSDMVKKNTYEVDAVSGATMSSQVIKKAVYNALTAGM
jgi:uncharacterized protein with FMN-binding domain